ncbi:phycobiliprotein lyase [Synechococcus sp. M16CYN]
MSLRSCFELSVGGDNEWHTSERGELTVRCEVSDASALGRLIVQAPGASTNTLIFGAYGHLSRNGEHLGRWRFWPDGSMELNVFRPDGVLVQERIWFVYVNLRLRSTTAVDNDGVPLQASFCTDIRRVSKPRPLKKNGSVIVPIG